jgi:hypothetical protein
MSCYFSDVQIVYIGRGAFSGEKMCLGGESIDPSLATANDVIIYPNNQHGHTVIIIIQCKRFTSFVEINV